jgi:hypothetical protein
MVPDLAIQTVVDAKRKMNKTAAKSLAFTARLLSMVVSAGLAPRCSTPLNLNGSGDKGPYEMEVAYCMY